MLALWVHSCILQPSEVVDTMPFHASQVGMETAYWTNVCKTGNLSISESHVQGSPGEPRVSKLCHKIPGHRIQKIGQNSQEDPEGHCRNQVVL